MFTVLGTKDMQKVRGKRSAICTRNAKCLTGWGNTVRYPSAELQKLQRRKRARHEAKYLQSNIEAQLLAFRVCIWASSEVMSLFLLILYYALHRESF